MFSAFSIYSCQLLVPLSYSLPIINAWSEGAERDSTHPNDMFVAAARLLCYPATIPSLGVARDPPFRSD